MFLVVFVGGGAGGSTCSGINVDCLLSCVIATLSVSVYVLTCCHSYFTCSFLWKGTNMLCVVPAVYYLHCNMFYCTVQSSMIYKLKVPSKTLCENIKFKYLCGRYFGLPERDEGLPPAVSK